MSICLTTRTIVATSRSRSITLKKIQDADRAQSFARKMFFNEAHMVGMLQHPNIMPIFDAGEEDGKYYVVTEHIQGARHACCVLPT